MKLKNWRGCSITILKWYKAEKKCDHVLAIIVILICPTQTHSAAEEWRLDKSKDGINVFSREYPGSEIREIKAVTQVKSSIDSVIAVIEDIPNSTRLNNVIVEARIEESSGNGSYKAYSRMTMPWPVKDRDIVSCRKFSLDKETLAVIITDVACKGLPIKKNLIRMTNFRQQWRITPLNRGVVNIELIAHSEPGSPIPNWIINQMSTDIPYQTLQNLKIISLLEPYASTGLKGIRSQESNR
ncbi:MAG: hypothetical protein KKF24_02040 [Gammaproteobacteria bacterium]|nr:hypothetical protein [Zhongshania sp.]MBU1831455.1 hypothetical protein [Gammaproteobacteria bacterium]